MKQYFISLFLVILSSIVYAQDIEFSQNLINQYYTAQQNALKKDADIHAHLWLTPILNEAIKNWDILTDEAKEIFGKYKNRPTFSGTEQILTYGNFALHYTTDGPSDESIDPTDADGDGFPDYAANMLYKFGDVYNLYHTTTGLTVPPNDDDEYNGAYYDIYVSGSAAGDGVYGYVAPETNVGDNTNSTDITETDAYTSFMVMRNNYFDFPNGDTDIPMEVTCAHEYMHATQNGYTGDMEVWFMEACATWAEDFAFPGDDDNLQYLMEIFGSPDIALNLQNGEADGNYDDHWYGAWIFMKYLTEHTENVIVKNIYERCIDDYAEYAIDDELSENWNSNFVTIFVQFLISNALMTDDNNFSPYTYSRASVYEAYILNNGGLNFENGSLALNYTGTDITWNSQTDGNDRLMRLSADYFVLTANQNFQISMNENQETGLILLKIKQNPETVYISYSDANGTINVTDADQWDMFIPIVLRFDMDATNTDPYDYTLSIKQAVASTTENTFDNIEIYPNPASNVLKINNVSNNKSIAIITDNTGKIVKYSDLNIGYNEINIKNLEKGVYFLTIKRDNKIEKIQKIIIAN